MKKLLLITTLLGVHFLSAQDFLRFSGVVLDQETIEPIDGTYIFNLSQGREAVTDSLGFFSLEATAGDTLVFRDVRYSPSTFVVPTVLQSPDYGIIQMLRPNSLLLDEVKVVSFPSEEEFVRSFMDTEPGPDLESRALEVQKRLMEDVKATYDNDRYYYEMWADRRVYELTREIQPNHIMDPFRWTDFIRNILQGQE